MNLYNVIILGEHVPVKAYSEGGYTEKPSSRPLAAESASQNQILGEICDQSSSSTND